MDFGVEMEELQEVFVITSIWVLCKAVLANWSDMSRGKFTACIFGNALQYTTAHLQVLFSLQ